MSLAYITESAMTSNFPPLFGHCFGGERHKSGAQLTDSATAPSLPQPLHQDISMIAHNINQYFASYSLSTHRKRILHSVRGLRLGVADQAGQLSQNIGTVQTSVSFLEPNSAKAESGTGESARATISATLDRLATRQAITNIERARDAAVAGDLRVAYRRVYQGLDELFRRGRWKLVSDELIEICKDKYPATFGIGAIRFSSDASSYIPNWDIIVNSLKTSAGDQGMDVERAMRGLLNNDGDL